MAETHPEVVVGPEERASSSPQDDQHTPVSDPADHICPDGNLLRRISHRIADQGRHELSLNLRATSSLEMMWVIARIALSITAMGAAYITWGQQEEGLFILIAGLGVLVGNAFLLYMLRQGKTATVFITGFAVDNMALFTAWTGTVWILRGALGSNDIYLAMFPILTLWAARLGFVFGIPYVALWLVWIGWSLNHFFHPQSYEVEQLPLRIVFIGMTTLVGMWATYMLRKQTLQSERRAARARSLQELATARNEFISGVSHELRTPLTVIMGFSETLNRSLKEVATDRQMNQLKAISRNGSHLNRLVGDLLDLTRLEAGNLSLTKEEFKVDDVLSDIAEGFEMILADKNQSLTVDSQSNSAWLNADRGRITQVLMNLMSNASKYSPPETAITLRSRFDGETVSIAVEDQGPGISEEDQQQMFTMFFRTANAEASSTPGNGIGLYLCKQIAEFHGGTISMDSEVGRGTAMTLTLPDAVLEEELKAAG